MPASAAPLRKYAPVKLSWWQKLLQLVGLYKAPTRPTPRPARQPDTVRPAVDPKVKSNTRNVRTGEGEGDGSGERRDDGERGRERSQERGGARGGEQRSRGGDRASVESPRVYVGNLSYDVSESDLQDLFKGIGGVRNVEIVYNRSTHRSKGYGFVEMLHVDEAKRAVEVLHDQPFMGRKLTVSGAQSKGQDDREDREERDDRPERRPRPTPVAAVATAATAEAAPTLTREDFEATTEITTIIESVAAPEPAAEETVVQATDPVPPVSEVIAPAPVEAATAADSVEESKAAVV